MSRDESMSVQGFQNFIRIDGAGKKVNNPTVPINDKGRRNRGKNPQIAMPGRNLPWRHANSERIIMELHEHVQHGRFVGRYTQNQHIEMPNCFRIHSLDLIQMHFIGHLGCTNQHEQQRLLAQLTEGTLLSLHLIIKIDRCLTVWLL